MPRTRHTYSAIFHEHVTLWRCVAVYASIVILLLGVTLPTIAVVKANQLSNHKDRAGLIVSNMSALVDDQITNLFAVVALFQGFAASAAPLQIPNYQTQDAATRANITLQTGTPDALSYEGFFRLYELAATRVIGFSSALVRPGLVNVFTPEGMNLTGTDLLTNGVAGSDREILRMVNTTGNVIRGPLAPNASGAINLLIRTPVFSNMSALITNDTNAIDPTTGQHPNWKYFWGGITVIIDMAVFAVSPNLTRIPGEDFDFMFESLPNSTRLIDTPYLVLSSSADPSRFQKDYISNCASTDRFQTLCFRIIPSSGKWRGDDIGTSLATAALLDIFMPLIALVAVVGLARLAVGPRPNPLQFAPRKAPFHAVCIDMVAANKMWAEVPFVMSEITAVFTRRLEQLAEEHCVHVALRLGNTVVVVSSRRSRIVDFTMAMATWAATHPWPAHVLLHCPYSTVVFTYMLHTCELATLWVDASGSECEAGGPDVQLLLLLRAAAVPGQVLCTGHFLGMREREVRPAPDVMSGARSSVESSEHITVEVSAAMRATRELGVCEVPLGLHGKILVRGFLMPSIFTANRSLPVVLESFPRWVWEEWRNPQASVSRSASNDNPPDPQPSDNPLIGNVHSPDDDGEEEEDSCRSQSRMPKDTHTLSRSNTNSRSKTASIATSRRDLSDLHQDNGEASEELPGSAVDLLEAVRLADLIVPLVLGRNMALHASRSETDTSSRSSSNISGPTRKQQVRRLQALLSLATYYLIAFRVVLAPLDAESRQVVVSMVSQATGIGAEHYFHVALAARCTRVTQQYADW
jgi:hypothetical protein